MTRPEPRLMRRGATLADERSRDLETRITRARELLDAEGSAIAEEVDAVLVAIQTMRVDGDDEARAA